VNSGADARGTKEVETGIGRCVCLAVKGMGVSLYRRTERSGCRLFWKAQRERKDRIGPCLGAIAGVGSGGESVSVWFSLSCGNESWKVVGRIIQHESLAV
jgi:hypothetical protein